MGFVLRCVRHSRGWAIEVCCELMGCDNLANGDPPTRGSLCGFEPCRDGEHAQKKLMVATRWEDFQEGRRVWHSRAVIR